MSGFTFGYTGSYIFSQTIFTYRTGVHSKWIGFFIMVVFFYVTVSPMNVLQMAPLFFFGATLIFIGYDLLYEWVRTRIDAETKTDECRCYSCPGACMLGSFSF
jgi:SulP family sulfate permease